MKKVSALILILLAQSAFAQGPESWSTEKRDKKVDFTTKINLKYATKDGIYINGYVVNIPYEKLTELNGKTVRITGKVKIVDPIGNFNEEGEVRQGRQTETKYIPRPRIRIIKISAD